MLTLKQQIQEQHLGDPSISLGTGHFWHPTIEQFYPLNK
jgi:hypothetical protein